MPIALSQQISSTATHAMAQDNEEMWIEVIQKMDVVYADLLRYQVELEEKNAELEEAQQFIRGVLTSMTDVLIVCDLSGYVQQSNLALSQLQGSSENGCVGAALTSLFDESSQASIETCLERIRHGETEELEVCITDATDMASPLVIRCSPRYDHEGILVGMVLIGRPVGELRKAYNDLNKTHTELKQAQAQLVQSEKMASLGRLVAGVAHELNNPISFVHSNMFAIKKYGYRLREYIEALHEQLGDNLDKDLRKKLKINRILDDIPSLVDGGLEGTLRVSTIVQDLRRFSSSHREEKTAFDVLDVVSNAAKWVTQTSRIRAKLSIEGEHLRINSYEGFVHQVLVNLIQNSLDAMEDEGKQRIDVRCYQQGNEVVITIKDYGTGISKQDKLKIFDPFFTTKDVGKGTGLGLYVSYGLIVEQCEGRLTADNHVDGGAVFTIALPYDADES